MRPPGADYAPNRCPRCDADNINFLCTCKAPEPPSRDSLPAEGEKPLYECPECGIKDYGKGRFTVPMKRFLFMSHCDTCDKHGAESMAAKWKKWQEEREQAALKLMFGTEESK